MESITTLSEFSIGKTISAIHQYKLLTVISFTDGSVMSVAYDGDKLNWMGRRDGDIVIELFA